MSRTDAQPDISQFFWPGLFCLFGGLLLPFAASAVSSDNGRMALLLAALLCWVSLPFLTIYFVLKTGMVRGKGSVAIRAREPLRFWVSFVFVSVLVFFIAALVSVFLWAAIFP